MTFETFENFAKLVAMLFSPHVEAVIHDLRTQKIRAIYNPFSLREVGDDSLLDDNEVYDDVDIIGPYEKRNHDGTLSRSSSLVIRDEAGAVIGLLCLNYNLSTLEALERLTQSLLKGNLVARGAPESFFKNDWRETIHEDLVAFYQEHHISEASFTNGLKRTFVQQLYQKGIFDARGSLPYVAKILKLSRPTLYTYLKSEAKT
ncbi:MAG: helix-turn-helix transcriptional regulator [Candidatus Nucleicultricaceae bacterium]